VNWTVDPTAPKPMLALMPVRPPLQDHVDAYMRYKKLRLTPASQRGYAGTLRELVRFFPSEKLSDFEPPKGTHLLEDFLVEKWGEREGRTLNKNLTVLCDFFKWHVLRENMLRDPTASIEKARVPELRHTTFTPEQRARILAVNPAPRDQIALRLLLDYGLRKGSLLAVRFDSFDPVKRRVSFHMKGDRYHSVPIPDTRVWELLAQLDEPGHHYLMPKQVLRKRRPPERAEFRRLKRALSVVDRRASRITDQLSAFEIAWTRAALDTAADWLRLAEDAASYQVVESWPDRGMGEHSAHDWWYHCLQRAGIVDKGVTRGQRMHQARHSAGQRVLEVTGNLKAAQALLGHRNISTTGNTYTGWDEHLDQTMADVVPGAAMDERLMQVASTAGRERSRT
jgi:site-specific recombinase XerC